MIVERAQQIAEALARAGIEKLPPPSRAHLAQRLAIGFASGDESSNNPAGLRDTTFGCARNGAPGLARFKDIDAGARAAVANAYRAAPRDWRSAAHGILSGLGSYPIHRGDTIAIPLPTADGSIRYGSVDEAIRNGAKRNGSGSWDLSGVTVDGKTLGEFKWSYLIPWYGDYARIRDYVSPSEEAEATFRGLVADWEGFERLGVGNSILIGEPDPKTGIKRISAIEDLRDWRVFRDDWRAGKLDVTERLNPQIAAANKVRKYLADYRIIDPALADIRHDRPGVDIEKSTAALADAAQAEQWCRGIPLCEWMTKPGQDCIATPLGCIPKNIAIVSGVGVGVMVLLSVAGAVATIAKRS